MAYTEKSLGDGQVASSTGDIVTPASSHTYLVTKLIFYNTNTTDETINVYFKKSGGTARQIARIVLGTLETFVLDWANGIALEASDAIRADTTTASKVDYSSFGVDKT